MDKVLLWSGGYDSTVLKTYLKDAKTFFCSIMYYDKESDSIKDNYVEEQLVKSDFKGFISLDRVGEDYVPGRNSVLVLSCVNNLLYKGIESAEIYMGLIKNFPRYPDATQEWVDAMNNVLEVQFGGKFKVVAPFINLTKDEVYKLGCSLGVKLEDTFSCNFEDEYGEPCGECDNCLWRAKHKYPEYWRIK